MGRYTLGPREDLSLSLARLAGAKTFVETGTFSGSTSRWAARHFETVYTIELSEDIYEVYHKGLEQLGNVKPLLGDSSKVLPSILEKIGDEPAVFWLDGHYSGAGTSGEENECPVLEELRVISPRKGDIIMIDDARLFLSAPPAPNQPSAWPTIPEILEVIDQPYGSRFIQIFGDIIFAVPNDDAIKACLIKGARDFQSGDFVVWAKIKMKLAIWNVALRRLRKGS